ncbi:uncharacterized protein EKO05_0010602 [Ascochyta rabiei]|uniref:uncharacterized protein n=1 Tax=Didymella rabiei TaxID=5454 RepID=UPI00220A9BBA|nr:uncharacterized protein EKO05_0010602 [Ascochyta rabiei]UPX20368.1 hypothetical protein EKO05_0010602 [Ascochyta rabiei]
MGARLAVRSISSELCTQRSRTHQKAARCFRREDLRSAHSTWCSSLLRSSGDV